MRALAISFLSMAVLHVGCGDSSPADGGNGGGVAGESSAGGRGGGGAGGGGAAAGSGTTCSSTLVLSRDDSRLFVVDQDADEISIIDTAARVVIAEIPLGEGLPAADPDTGRFEPAVLPRGLALVNDAKVYVAGQASDSVLVIDVESASVVAEIPVAAAPVSVLAAEDGSSVYVVSHEGAVVTKIDPETDSVVATLEVGPHPWGAALSADGSSLFVTHLLLEPGITIIDTASFSVRGKTPLEDEPRGRDKRLPNGTARGAYVAVPRPSTGELWVPHLLLGIGTPQPELDFESTVFPTITTFEAEGASPERRLLFQPGVPGAVGAFGDSVSGPRAIAFTPDGKLALLALSQSEDLMVFDAEAGVERSLVRPLPSAFLEGVVVDHAGKRAYVDGRNTHDVTVLSIDPADEITPVRVDGDPIERLAVDPMPAPLRLGQRLFYSANSARFPITKNFWVACSSCHIEGGSDGVTWQFGAGPRDTPSNAGGPSNTGFLMRQALRNQVEQYDLTIRVEQGGSYEQAVPAHAADLAALAAFVNLAIPYPSNPNVARDGTLDEAQTRGKATFDAQCRSCHAGEYLTDSGAGNPSLDLSGTVVLHDVGTCVQSGDFPDHPSTDEAGNARGACELDTPSLRGVFASPPYFHDGSALTLRDVVDRLPMSASLPEGDKDDLVAYLLTL